MNKGDASHVPQLSSPLLDWLLGDGPRADLPHRKINTQLLQPLVMTLQGTTAFLCHGWVAEPWAESLGLCCCRGGAQAEEVYNGAPRPICSQLAVPQAGPSHFRDTALGGYGGGRKDWGKEGWQARSRWCKGGRQAGKAGGRREQKNPQNMKESVRKIKENLEND